MTEYRVKPKRWQECDKSRIGLVWVSLSKEETKGDKLKSIACWMDAHFDKWYIDLADTLDRHNRSSLYSLSSTTAEKSARQAGAEWRCEQSEALSGAKNLGGIISFDYWRDHKDFPEILDNLYHLLETDKAYADAVNADANVFLNRRFSAGMSQQRRQELLGSGISYILEESAAGILAAKKFHAVRFYPGAELSSITLLRSGKIEGSSKDYAREEYVEVDLARRGPAPKPAGIPVFSKEYDIGAVPSEESAPLPTGALSVDGKPKMMCSF